MDKTKANEHEIDNLVDNLRLSQDNNSEQQQPVKKDPVAPIQVDDTPVARSHGNTSPKLFQAKRQKRRQPIFVDEQTPEPVNDQELRRL